MTLFPSIVAIRAADKTMSPGAIVLGRLLISSVALGAVAFARCESFPSRRDIARIGAYGILWLGVYSVALNEAERRIDAGTAAMLIGTGPLLIALLAGVFLREGLSAAVVRRLCARLRWLLDHGVCDFAGRVSRRFQHRALSHRRSCLLGCGGCAETGRGSRLGPPGHVAWLRGGNCRMPAIRATVAARRRRGWCDCDRLHRVPWHRPNGDRLRHVDVCPSAYQCRPHGRHALLDLPPSQFSSAGPSSVSEVAPV